MNNNFYKYYMYYKKDKNDKYKIYAYTDDKHIAKLFENQRNMSKFKVKVKDITKDDIKALAEYHQTSILEIVPIKFYDRETNKEYNVDYALTTLEKLEFIRLNSIATIKIYNSAWDSPLIFKKEIQKALFVLGYYDCHIYLSNNIDNVIHDNDNKMIRNIKSILKDNIFYTEENEDEYIKDYIELICSTNQDMQDNIKIDQLSILIKCIKETL